MADNILTTDERDRNVDPITYPEERSADELPDNLDMVENEDGSVDILSDEKDENGKTEFMGNLADHFQSSTLAATSLNLVDLVDHDKEARSKRDEQYADGIKRTGLGNEAPGGAEFEGASKAVHPLLAEGCIDFAARAIKELFPPAGPVKQQIIGSATPQKLDRAQRKKTYMNWQLQTQIKEYRAELEQLLTQLPLGGSQYLKIWYDERFKRPRAEFIPIDDVFLPYSVASFSNAHRCTHRQMITKYEFEGRIASGLYREIRNISSPQNPNDEQSEASKASDKVEGLEDDLAYNDDGLRAILEIYVQYEFDEDDKTKGESSPYIITIDETTREILAVYRNWDEEDELRLKLDWIVDWNFIPWRGVYAIGLPHIIGSLSGAVTGSLRALLDSAHINNAASMLKLKGARTSGQNVQIEIGEVSEIEGPAGIDDIRKLAMPVPFNPPSPVLMQIMQWMVQEAKGVVATSEESIADASDNMPMGTALALIEQGSKVFSAIHGRLHESQKKALEIIHRINGVYLSDKEVVEELGELVVSRDDFQGPMDIIPVSDPNIFSEAQRYAQLQAVSQLSDKYPQYFKTDQIAKRAMQLLNFQDYEEVMTLPKDPEQLDPVSENVHAAKGDQPLKAYEDQDHMAHLSSHVAFLSSPLFCLNPLMAQPGLPAMLAHIKEHLIFQYEKHARAAMEAAVEFAKSGEQVPEGADPITHALALADQALATQLAPFMQHIQQAMQQQSQLCPAPPPTDPNAAVALQVGMANVQQKTQSDQAKLAQQQQQWQQEQQRQQQAEAAEAADDQRQAQMQAANDQRDAMRQQMAEQSEAQREANNELMRMVADLIKNENDNHTKVLVADISATKQAMDDTSSMFQEQIQNLVQQLQSQSETQSAMHDEMMAKIPSMIDQAIQSQPGMIQKFMGMFGGQQQQVQPPQPPQAGPQAGKQ